MEFKEKLIKLRKDSKLETNQLAIQLNVSETDIDLWEKGEALPSIEQTKQIASFYDVTIESLLDDNSEIIKNKKSTKKKLNNLKLVAKLLYFFTIGLCILYFNSFLTTVLFQKNSLKLIYGIQGDFIFPIAGFIGALSLFLFIVLLSSKLATRLSKQTKGFASEITVLLILPLILLFSELMARLQTSILSNKITDFPNDAAYILRFINMLGGCRAMINGIAPLFIFALMMSLVIKVLDKSPYQPKIINGNHKVGHNFLALLFGYKVGLFSLPFYIAFKKEQFHICKKTKMSLFYTLGFIASFWKSILIILIVALLAYLRGLMNF